MLNTVDRDEKSEMVEENIRELLENLSCSLTKEEVNEIFYYLYKVIEIADLDINMDDLRDTNEDW